MVGVSRRQMLKAGLVGGGGAALLLSHRSRSSEVRAGGPPATPFWVTPFAAELPVPPVLQPVSGGLPTAPGDVYHGIAPEFSRNHANHGSDWSDPATATQYLLHIEETVGEIIPGVFTPVFTYRDGNMAAGQGATPGPTILARFNEPLVVRNINELESGANSIGHDIEISTHLHGGHSPPHSDGYPNFYVLPGMARDYYYPNVVPKRLIDGKLQFDRSTIPSTMWYHDHGMDITGFTVSHGLAGFYLYLDDFEEGLMEANVIPDVRLLESDPGNSRDIPIAITDQRFNADETLYYDFLDHNGRIGDVFTVNGAVQPFFRVQRAKYRFRLLNASNARVYQLRLSNRQPMLQIGNDSWLLPEPVAVKSIRLAMGERADVIVDFTNAPSELYLENIMYQPDGRGPKEVNPKKERTGLIKFVVEGGVVPNDVTIDETTALRPHDPILASDIVRTRRFDFDRSNGAWTVNGEFFNPRRCDADPEIDPDGIQAERWILKNNSGGWWHPIHVHLEHQEIQKLNGVKPPFARRFKSDVATLSDNGEAEIFMRFRSFTGPFASHCHNLEHEDMRMMLAFDPQPTGAESPLNGVDEIDPNVSGVPQNCEELEPHLLFDSIGDVETLEGRGVGFPCDDFEPSKGSSGGGDSRGRRGRRGRR